MAALFIVSLALAGCQIVRVYSRECIPEIWLDLGVISVESCREETRG
jgi:hypothetical protein